MNPPRKQCRSCPWLVGTDPHSIPRGYSRELHQKLEDTIAEPGRFVPGDPLRAMACHHSPVGSEVPCVGWLVHQLGEGGNIPLRSAVAFGHVDGNVETIGEQHAAFAATLPPRRGDAVEG